MRLHFTCISLKLGELRASVVRGCGEPGAGSRVPKSSFVHGSMSLRTVHNDGIEGGWPSIRDACMQQALDDTQQKSSLAERCSREA